MAQNKLFVKIPKEVYNVLSEHYQLGKLKRFTRLFSVLQAGSLDVDEENPNQQYEIKIIKKSSLSNPQIIRLKQIQELIITEKPDFLLPFDRVFYLKSHVCIVQSNRHQRTLQEFMDKSAYEIQVDQLASKVIRNILKALNYLHKQGIVHKNIKPSNILIPNLRQIDQIKIIGTGLSFIDDQYGMAEYTAPELNNSQQTPSFDIWSVGIIMYKLIKAKHPFFEMKTTDEEIFNKIKNNIYLIPREELNSKSQQSFFNKMTRMFVKDRFTASRALMHQWLSRQHRQSLSYSSMSKSYRPLYMSKSNVCYTQTTPPKKIYSQSDKTLEIKRKKPRQINSNRTKDLTNKFHQYDSFHFEQKYLTPEKSEQERKLQLLYYKASKIKKFLKVDEDLASRTIQTFDKRPYMINLDPKKQIPSDISLKLKELVKSHYGIKRRRKSQKSKLHQSQSTVRLPYLNQQQKGFHYFLKHPKKRYRKTLEQIKLEKSNQQINKILKNANKRLTWVGNVIDHKFNKGQSFQKMFDKIYAHDQLCK